MMILVLSLLLSMQTLTKTQIPLLKDIFIIVLWIGKWDFPSMLGLTK